MSNLLDMECPKCGDTDRIDIAATVWVRVCEDGTDADLSRCQDQDYTPDSPALCAACNHIGTVRSFEIAGGVE